MDIFPFYTAELIFSIALVSIGVYLLWLNPKKSRVLLFLPLIFLLYALSWEMSGWPLPYNLEWRKWKEPEIISFSLDEPRAIYIWAKVDGVPRSYKLPWSLGTAESLVEARRLRFEEGQGSRLKFLFLMPGMEASSDVILEDPQPAPEPKQ